MKISCHNAGRDCNCRHLCEFLRKGAVSILSGSRQVPPVSEFVSEE